ncbi:glycosyltransferase, partial [candidate division KSB1 bacterium]|nr:glycosyltransferase [candidate division KSB1 bacterium]
ELKKYDAFARQPDTEIMVIRPSNWTDKARNEASDVTERTYNLISAPVMFSGYRHRSFFTQRLKASIKQFAPDIVHVFDEANTLFCFQGLLWSKRLSRRPRFFFDNFQNILYDKIPFRFSAFYRMIEKRVFSEAAGATVRYQGSHDFLRHRGYRGPIHIVPWGVDEKLFTKVEVPKRKGFNIGYIGRLEDYKGIFVLLEAFRRLDQRFYLTIVGEGSAKSRVSRWIQENNMSERVVLTGYIRQEKLFKYYSAIDCLVVPTLTIGCFKEQFGRVIVEAMACETPVIGSTSGSIPSLIDDAGLVYDEQDTDQLVLLLNRMADDPELHARLAKKSGERVLEQFTWNRFARECLRFYHEVK